MKHTYYIGLDVHAKTVTIAWACDDGRLEAHGSCSSSNPSVERTLRKLAKKLGVTLQDLRVCYEAGPTGFVLARRLIDLGVDCIIAAPSLIPRQSGDKIKTDKRDARKLARLHRSGDLVAVHIPDKDDEAIRDLCRARTDAMEDAARSKQRLTAFLLRNGHRYRGGGNWSEAHRRYLRELSLPCPVLRSVLEEYLLAVDAAKERVERLEALMADMLPGWRRRREVEWLMGLKGFQLVAAMTLVSELGDLSRFNHPRQLMAFLGLVPSERTTGTRRRQGAITKCGNSHARWMLIESSLAYRPAPKLSAALSRRQAGLPRAVKELSWRAQQRLSRRYRRLKARGLHENKAIVAVARELSAFLWELQVKLRPAAPNT
jgi:transposase